MPYPMKSKPSKQATFRICKALLKEVRQAAHLEDRSMRSYIERALETALTISATTTAR